MSLSLIIIIRKTWEQIHLVFGLVSIPAAAYPRLC